MTKAEPAGGVALAGDSGADDAVPEGKDDDRAGGSLRQEGLWDHVQAHGGDDAVVRRSARVALRAVADGHGRGEAHCLQVPGRGLDEAWVDVHARHVGVAEPVREQRQVVAGSGPQLEHPVSLVDVQGLKHAEHERGLAGRTGGDTTVVELRRQRCVAVDRLKVARLSPGHGQPRPLGVLPVEAGREHVSGNGGERVAPLADASFRESCGELLTRGGRSSVVGPVHAVAPIRYSACAAAIGRPVRFSTHPQVPAGLFSKNTHCPAGVTAKSNAPNAIP